MKNTLTLSVLAAGLALVGCSKSDRTSTASNNPPPPADSSASLASRAETIAKNAGDTVAATAHQLEWRLTSDDIKDDLAAGRTIIRTKAGAPTGATVDRSDLKTAVLARLRSDSDLSNIPIDVDADRDGQINLDGKANTVDQVGRAMALALATDNVTKVSSKIKIDKQGNAHR
jgi:osmotically-inducible protein OsmY